MLHTIGVAATELGTAAAFGRKEGSPKSLADAAGSVDDIDPLVLSQLNAFSASELDAANARKPMDAFDSDGIEPIGWERVIPFRQSKRVPPHPADRKALLKWSKSYYQMRFLKKGT